MLGFLPTRAYRPGTPGATTFLSPLSGTFNYGWDSFSATPQGCSEGRVEERGGPEAQGYRIEGEGGREGEGSGQEVKGHSRVGASEPSVLTDWGLTAFSGRGFPLSRVPLPF